MLLKTLVERICDEYHDTNIVETNSSAVEITRKLLLCTCALKLIHASLSGCTYCGRKHAHV